MKCGCNEDAIIREVKKEGPNKGKKFYTCAKPQGSQCEFFEWIDKPAPRTQSGVQSQALTNLTLRMDKMAEFLKGMDDKLNQIVGDLANRP